MGVYQPDPVKNARQGIDSASDCSPSCLEFHVSSLLRRAFLPVEQHIADYQEFAEAISDGLARLRRKKPPLRVVIAGSTDNGLYCMLLNVARKIGGDEFARSLIISIVDRCKMPLVFCEQFAVKNSLRLNTVHSDFIEFSHTASCDLLIAHGVMSFFPSDERNTYLSHMRNWLSIDGMMISSTQFGDRNIAGGDEQNENGRLQDAVANLNRLLDKEGIEDSHLRATLAQKLHTGFMNRSDHAELFGNREEALSFYEGAGLKICKLSIVDNTSQIPQGPQRRYRARAIATCLRAEE